MCIMYSGSVCSFNHCPLLKRSHYPGVSTSWFICLEPDANKMLDLFNSYF